MVRVGWQDVAPSDPRCVLRARGLGQRALQPHASPYRPGNNVGGCQNYGPFLGTLNIKCRITIGIQKETIILTATHMGVSQNRGPMRFLETMTVLTGLVSEAPRLQASRCFALFLKNVVSPQFCTKLLQPQIDSGNITL